MCELGISFFSLHAIPTWDSGMEQRPHNLNTTLRWALLSNHMQEMGVTKQQLHTQGMEGH